MCIDELLGTYDQCKNLFVHAQVRRQQDGTGVPNQSFINNIKCFGGAVEDLTQRMVDDYVQAVDLQEDNLCLHSALENGKATINSMQMQVHGMGPSI